MFVQNPLTDVYSSFFRHCQNLKTTEMFSMGDG